MIMIAGWRVTSRDAIAILEIVQDRKVIITKS